MPRAVASRARSWVISSQPTKNPTTKTTPPSQAAWARPLGVGRPAITAGTTSNGSMNRVPVLIREAAVSPVPTVVGSSPDSVSMRYWSAPPAAAPPGTTRLKALAASCAVATPNQRCVRSASRWSPQMHTKLANSSASIATNQSGSSVSRSGQVSSTVSRLGHRM